MLFKAGPKSCRCCLACSDGITRFVCSNPILILRFSLLAIVGWEVFDVTEAIGFACLVVGAMIYNDLVFAPLARKFIVSPDMQSVWMRGGKFTFGVSVQRKLWPYRAHLLSSSFGWDIKGGNAEKPERSKDPLAPLLINGSD